MDNYVTGAAIRSLREAKGLTQEELAVVCLPRLRQCDLRDGRSGDQGVQIVKLYPEGNAEARFRRRRVSSLYAYCNRHGLFRLTPFRTGKIPLTRGQE